MGLRQILVRCVGAAILLALGAQARAQLVMSSEYFLVGNDGAYSTWSVRVSNESRPRSFVRHYETQVTGVVGLERFRLLQKPAGGTNWMTLGRGRSDLFGFLNLSRGRRWSMRDVAAQKVPACAERLALVSGDGVILAEAALNAPEHQSISGPLRNTGVDPLAAGVVSFSVSGDTQQFRLFLTGASAQYTLWINDTACATYAGSDGMLEVGNYPEGAPAFNDVRRFAITDDAGREILAAELY